MAQGRSSFFIIILTVLITTISSLSAENLLGIGKGSRTCDAFIKDTAVLHDNGNITDLAYFNRMEYLQWAHGFMTALNVRQFEKYENHKDLEPVTDYQVLYERIASGCGKIATKGHNSFSMATFVVFYELPQDEEKNY